MVHLTLLSCAASTAVTLAMLATHAIAQPTSANTTGTGPAAAPAAGPFQPTWESLATQQTPEWFRDAKFGIWAHWGPQCAPEAGDWYARHMYTQGHWQYAAHLKKYGHPSKAGFKDVIHAWKAERWDPEALVALYKRAGAQYFFAMANHHDNLDLWDSKHQPWNSLRVGPRKDIVAGWAKAARANDLKFGVSVHSAHAWLWYEPSQGADKTGELAGVPYDGKLTKADGAGTWWDGLDPQDLYAQRHAPSPGFQESGGIHGRWEWGNGASVPDAAYCQNFLDRTTDLVDTFKPDLVYFDDTALPLWPVSDVGLKVAAHIYNDSAARHGGANQAIVFGKVLDEAQRKAVTWDVERGAPDAIQPLPWQTCTCIGDWHYNRGVYNRKAYKSATLVAQMLCDIVSKNGNLLLNVPVRGDGSIDELERKVVEDLTAWMDVNRPAILATRPFKVYGEGPSVDNAAKISKQGFNEGKVPFTAADVRFTQSKDGSTLYAIVLGFPDAPLSIKALGTRAGHLEGEIESVTLLGVEGPVAFERTADALVLQPGKSKPCEGPVAFKIALRR